MLCVESKKKILKLTCKMRGVDPSVRCYDKYRLAGFSNRLSATRSTPFGPLRLPRSTPFGRSGLKANSGLKAGSVQGLTVAPAGFLHMMLLSCRLLCECRVGRLAPPRFGREIGYICDGALVGDDAGTPPGVRDRPPIYPRCIGTRGTRGTRGTCGANLGCGMLCMPCISVCYRSLTLPALSYTRRAGMPR